MTKNRKGGKGQALCVHLSPLLSMNVFPRILPVDFLLCLIGLNAQDSCTCPAPTPTLPFLFALGILRLNL